MPSRGSFAHFVDSAEKLLANVAKNAAELPDFSALRTALAETLEQAKATGAEQQSRRGVKQQETQDHQELVKEGKARMAKLRAALRSHFGFTSPRLHEFGILPLGVKKRKKTDEEQPGPEEPKPETPGSGSPGGTVSAKDPQTS